MARGSSFFGAAALLVALAWTPPASAKVPTSWDGLTQVHAKNVDYLYLRPGADFRGYKSILLDPVEVAFQKNWQRDMNRSRRGLSSISDADVRAALDEARGKLKSTFEKRLTEAGFKITSAPAEDALRIFVGVGNIQVSAPELQTPGRSRVYSEEAGRATLVIEARDSLSGELLGRAVDHGIAGDNLMTWRTSASNRADFEQMFDDWARISASGLRKLLTAPPIAPQ